MATPVIICDPERFGVLFMNTAARTRLLLDADASPKTLDDVLRFSEKNGYDSFLKEFKRNNFLRAYHARIFADTQAFSSEINAHTVMDGEARYILVEVLPLPDDDTAEMRCVLDNVEAMIYVSDFKTYEILYMNNALKRDLGIIGDATGKICWQTLQRGQTGPCDFCPNARLFDEDGNPSASLHEDFQNTISGKWFSLTDSVIRWVDGRYAHMETAVEITKQKQNVLSLEKSASLDTLTGVYNRGWGYKLADGVMRKMREERQPFSIVFVDIDGLKEINDNYSHAEGDNAILQVVEQLRRNIRKSDIIFRWGGDEFVLVLPACPHHKASVIMNNTLHGLETFNAESGKPFCIGISYGIEEIPYLSDYAIDDIINRADTKMYDDKQRKGR